MTISPGTSIDFQPLLRPGDTVVVSQGLGEPYALTRQLVAQRQSLGPLDVFLGPGFDSAFDATCADTFRLRSWCATGGNARLAAAGALDILPSHYSELDALFDSGALRCDVALLSASGPDAQGRFYLGLNVDYTLAAARRARVVILEVNDAWPCVPGALLPDDIRPDLIVHTHRPPKDLPGTVANPGETERAIARHAASLIADGATLSVGVGSLPDLVIRELMNHRDLGIHSPILVDRVVDLIEAGAVTNARKTVDRGVSVAGLLMGGARLLDFLREGPPVRLAPATYTHAVSTFAALPQFVALTGALEVDLTGQINAEMAQGRYVGAVGGQLDLFRGARASRGGQAITMLPSTALGAKVSRIVPRLADSVVTTPRSDVDKVVTEFGIADLRGKGLAGRVEAMVKIAHPDFRDALAVEGERIARLAR